MIQWITAAVMLIGGMLALLAAVGINRLPDFYTRMHAASKSTTLGVGFILVAVALHFNDIGETTQVLLTIAFLLLTAPVAAHMIARAAYAAGTPQWEHSVLDELAEHCQVKSRKATGDEKSDYVE